MLGKSKKVKRGLLSVLILRGLTKNIGTALLIGGIAGGLLNFFRKSAEQKPKKMVRSGVYGAVAIARAFKGADFPLTRQQIMDRYGDKEIEYHRGHCEKVRDVLSVIPNETFNSTVDVEHAFREFTQKNQE